MSDFRIRISVKGLFFNEKGEIALIKSPHGNYWAAPGGGLEEKETLIEAVERELLEETGFKGEAKKPVFIQDFVNQKGNKQLEIFFLGRIIEKVASDSEHVSKFFSEEQFKKINFKPASLNPFDLKEAWYKPLSK